VPVTIVMNPASGQSSLAEFNGDWKIASLGLLQREKSRTYSKKVHVWEWLIFINMLTCHEAMSHNLCSVKVAEEKTEW